MKRLLFLVGDTAGCAHYRMMLPARALEKTGKYQCRVSMVIDKEKAAWDPDLIIVSRQDKPEVLTLLSLWKNKYGKRIIYDLDDDLIHVYPSNPSFSAMQKTRTFATKIIKLCDKLTVSTQPLKTVYDEIHQRVEVLPNQIIPQYAKLGRENKTGKIRIGWAGTNTHQDDFAGAAHALIDIIKLRPEVQLVFFGYVPDIIRANIPAERIEYHKFVDIGQYHLHLGMLALDVGIAPLKDTLFNRSKSNLKFLEYGVMGVPTIASPVYPYSTSIKDGITGLLPPKDRHKEWVKALLKIVDDPTFRKQMGSTAQQHVLDKYDVNKNVGFWESAYELDSIPDRPDNPGKPVNLINI